MGRITVIGLGASDLNQMPIGIYKMLKEEKNIYFRTKEHPVINELVKEGITFTSFDEIYEKHEEFSDVYDEIVITLISESINKNIVYAVPGHPLVAEMTVKMLIDYEGCNKFDLEILGGQSFLDAMFSSLRIDPIEGFQFLDATSFNKNEINLKNHLIFCQVYDKFIASNLKIELLELLPYDYIVKVVISAGSSEEKIYEVALEELDHNIETSNLMSVYVPPVQDEALLNNTFNRLREIITKLRSPEGCPWDRKQTHHSLKKYLLEETYELLDAIEKEDITLIEEELGDVLLQIMLHSEIADEEGYFNIHNVIELLNEKLIRRHPHVFGEVKVENENEVIANWEEIKKQEKKEEMLFRNVSNSLPSLMKAYELQKDAAKLNLDFENVEQIWDKVQEELTEFKNEISKDELKNRDHIKEFGDLIFSIVNLARFYKINPEEALEITNSKFKDRIYWIFSNLQKQGINMADVEINKLNELWEMSKKSIK
ncbi:MAG: nucleoside triphosphate pyrophosphohydrolase [Bacillales bacterium]|jgi:tetrapyrrole methylase family protein/MazG family protein|nr:nucleoside triphosphate pyrophosphohydrolase [Bacillales bacterium]